MGKMDDFEITGFVSASEFGAMKILDPRCRELWEKIIQGLKDKPEALPVIGQPLKTKAEARKKSRFLMSQKRLMGSAYNGYGIGISGNEETGYRLIGVTVKPKKVVIKGKGKRAEKREKGVEKRDGNGQTADMQDAQIAEQQKAMLDLAHKGTLDGITNGAIPASALQMLLKQHEGVVAKLQQKLASQSASQLAPGLKEAEAAEARGELKKAQEIVEAIKKRLG